MRCVKTHIKSKGRQLFIVSLYSLCLRGVYGITVIVIGNGHGGSNSNTGWSWLHFT